MHPQHNYLIMYRCDHQPCICGVPFHHSSMPRLSFSGAKWRSWKRRPGMLGTLQWCTVCPHGLQMDLTVMEECRRQQWQQNTEYPMLLTMAPHTLAFQPIWLRYRVHKVYDTHKMTFFWNHQMLHRSPCAKPVQYNTHYCLLYELPYFPIIWLSVECKEIKEPLNVTDLSCNCISSSFI